ncbi:MAG: cytochrome P450 [Chloroflexi bacterium]|nr:cytochrome P450 [Chloroflexota bacterium]
MPAPQAEVGREVLKALIRERSLLGPLRVMFARVGRIFQIPLFFFHPFVVAGPEAARKVLVTERQKLRWRNPDPVTDVLRKGVLVTDGPEHDHYRALMEPSLTPGVLPGYSAMMLRQAERVTALWQDGQTVDMLVESRKITLLIVMEALFGVDAWDDLGRIWKPILKAIEFVSPGAWILWRGIPRPSFRKPLAELDAYLYGIISKRRQSLPKPDLLGHLIEADLDDDRIRDQMLTMLIAGHDTSTALLAWTFVLLGQHPDEQARLVASLDVAESDTHPHLLDDVIKEALRLYPPIHIGNRVVAEEMIFEGQSVPAGERLFYSIYLTHRDPKSWDKPDDFCPERFEHGRKQPAFAYLPFGGGPRACIGAAFGQAEARILVTYLLKTFSFVPLNMAGIHAHMGATLEPRPGVFMKVSRRAAVL